MCQRIKRWNPVGFRAKADFASGPAANHLKRLTQSSPHIGITFAPSKTSMSKLLPESPSQGGGKTATQRSATGL
jgi:hypothetical protein